MLATLVGIALDNNRLRIAADIDDADTLKEELQNFRLKKTSANHDSFEAWRSSDKDDLVLATSLAIWGGERIKQPTRMVRMNWQGPGPISMAIRGL